MSLKLPPLFAAACFACLFLPISASAQSDRAPVDAPIRAPITVGSQAALIEIAHAPLPGAAMLEWSNDGALLAAATETGVVAFSTEALLAGDEQPLPLGLPIDMAVQALAFRPNSTQIATAVGGRIRIWDVASASEIRVMDGLAPLAFSADGGYLAYITLDGLDIETWDMEAARPAALLHGHTERILDLDFSPTGTMLATVSRDNTLRVWDAITGSQLRFQRSRGREFFALDFSPNGATIASSAERGVVRLLNLAVTTEGAYNARTMRVDVTRIEFNPTGDLVAFTLGDSVQLWGMDVGVPPTAYTLAAPVLGACFNPDGTLLAVLTTQGIHLWAARSD